MQTKIQKKKVILTGATGVIGAAVIRQCIKRGWDVCAVIRPQSFKNKYIEETGAVIVPCDLEEIQTLKDNVFCQKADYFIHLGWVGTQKAAREDREVQQKNITYTVNACEVAAQIGCSVFVFAGSQAEYGMQSGCIHPDLPVKPVSEYAKAKVEAGHLTQELCKHKNMYHIYARILSVYGPCNEMDTMVMSTIVQLLNGYEPKFTAGEQMWDYLYCDDAAEALLLLAEKGIDGQIYCVGSGVKKPLRYYIEKISGIINPNIALGFGKVPYASNQIMELYADIEKLQKHTGFSPAVTFDEGIRRTRDWILEWQLDKE